MESQHEYRIKAFGGSNGVVRGKVAMTISSHKTRSVFDRHNIISPKQVLDAMKQVEQSEGKLLKADGSSMEVRKSGRRK